MATGSMVPYSNPAGNNQTTPKLAPTNGTPSPMGGVPMTPTAHVLQPGAVAASNPLVPTAGLPGTGTPGATDALQDKQLVDIYGKGVGGDVNTLLDSIGGANSATLDEFKASLVPQEATAQANLNASLGAAGVGANSSVAAIGDANLQAQETAAIAGETAQLTQSGQQLDAQLLTGMEGDASKEVASSGWDVFGDVMNAVGGLAGQTVAAAGKAGGFSSLFG